MNLIRNWKRAWRLTKLLNASELSDESALGIEKLDTIYLDRCRQIQKSLEKASKIIKGRAQAWTKDNDRKIIALEDSLTSSITEIRFLLAASQKSQASQLGDVADKAGTTMELVNSIRDYVGQQANENRRWQEGYDWRILKNYVMRMITMVDDIDTKIEGYRRKDKPAEFLVDLAFFRETIEIHLEEEGIVPITPELNSIPDPSLVEVKGATASNDSAQSPGSVASVIKKGYLLELGEESKLIRKPQVFVYKKENENGNSSRN